MTNSTSRSQLPSCILPKGHVLELGAGGDPVGKETYLVTKEFDLGVVLNEKRCSLGDGSPDPKATMLSVTNYLLSEGFVTPSVKH